jgi:hypothetical protein
VKGLENYGNQAEGEGEMDDAIAAQVTNWLIIYRIFCLFSKCT